MNEISKSPNYNIENGNLGLQPNQYDITAIMQINKTVASSYLLVCCHSGELQILKINGRERKIEHVHLIHLYNKATEKSTTNKAVKQQKSSLYGL